jgi:hypothetical protein
MLLHTCGIAHLTPHSGETPVPFVNLINTLSATNPSKYIHQTPTHKHLNRAARLIDCKLTLLGEDNPLIWLTKLRHWVLSSNLTVNEVLDAAGVSNQHIPLLYGRRPKDYNLKTFSIILETVSFPAHLELTPINSTNTPLDKSVK